MNPFTELASLSADMERYKDQIEELKAQAEGTASRTTTGGQNPNRKTKSPQEIAAYKLAAVHDRNCFTIMKYATLKHSLTKALFKFGEADARSWREADLLFNRYLNRMSLKDAAKETGLSYNTARGYNGRAVRAFLDYWADNGAEDYDRAKAAILADELAYFGKTTEAPA